MPKSEVRVVWVCQIIVHQRSVVNAMWCNMLNEMSRALLRPFIAHTKTRTNARKIMVQMI